MGVTGRRTPQFRERERASVTGALSVLRNGHQGAGALDLYWECARTIGSSRTRTATRELISAVRGTNESIRREAALHKRVRIIAEEALGAGIARRGVQAAVARLATEILQRCANHRDHPNQHASLRVWKSPPSAQRA